MSSHASSKTGTDRWGRAVRTDTAASVFGPDLLAALELEQVSTQHCWLFLRARTSTWCRDKLALSWVNASGRRQINALETKKSTSPAPGQQALWVIQGYVVRRLLCYFFAMSSAHRIY